MDASLKVFVKEEIPTCGVDNHPKEELIIPDFVSPEDVDSPNEDFKIENAVKPEPMETTNFIDADDDLENPYLCFECGLDCESQRELIDHYETTHTGQNSRQLDNNGNPCSGTESSDDPLAGDEAPDSPKKIGNVEGAQNDATTQEVLLLYSCPCCGHSDTDWSHLIKHMEKHVQVSCLSCVNCTRIFSSSYPLKDCTGKDPADEPHVCCHCPFKTQWYQALKDHCVTHHRNTAADGSVHNNQNYTPSNAFETFSSQPQSSVPTLAVPYSGSQVGCFVLVNSNIPGRQEVVNVATPISGVVPAISSVHAGPNNVNVIPQVLNLNHINPLPAPTVRHDASNGSIITFTHHPGGIYNGSANTLSNIADQKLFPRLVPKVENPAGSNLAASPRLSIPETANPTVPSKIPVNELFEKKDIPKIPPSPPMPKSGNRTMSPKVPVDELLKRWDLKIKVGIPNVAPAPPKPVLHPNRLLLSGLPPSRAPRGSLEKTRRGIKTKPCPYCSHVARDSHSLKTHIFIHTNEKPFKCDICDYRATQRAHVQKHMATHINPRGKHYLGEINIEQ